MNIIVSFNLCIILFSILFALYYALPKYTGLSLVLKAQTWYLILVFIMQASIAFLWWNGKQNSFFVFHIGVVTDAIPLLLMYREMFKKHIEEKEVYVYRKIFIILIAFFVVFAIVNALCWQPLNTYPSYTRTALSVVIILCSALHFYKYTYEPVPKEPLELVEYVHTRVPLFWINMGLLLFTSATSLISIYGGVLFNDKEHAIKAANISIIQAVLCFLFYIIIGIAFIKAKKRSR